MGLLYLYFLLMNSLAVAHLTTLSATEVGTQEGRYLHIRHSVLSSSSSVCGARLIPPNALQPTETYCANPAFGSHVHLQMRSTSDGVKDLRQRKKEL
jgi:hypothetical protein